ncbi:SusC/RagA family TonB-linked outer membrane protein [Parabacteroides chongii]|uniref:SusC/RagA family TonB-linked outer membrane protein n=1 Tax=Parabacteroides chongii TaxID=2685834 RepID=UPI00240E3D86|nr:SusC/RagA family TonB-linked outer membrane protein [Parabacteroides chongii]WFE82805.1 SusC/RagA family TonB-linked outer membrane protein [Parabacteroides chongii]
MENITAINRKKINYVKLACLLISLISFSSLITHASNPSETSEEVLTVQMQNKTLKEVFSYIEKNSSYVFIYEEAVDLEKKINVNISDKSIEDIIKEVFSSNGFSYIIKGRQVIVKKAKETNSSIPVTAQNDIVIRGTVTDHTGMPLVGVNVIVKGATIGTVTDIDGHFDLANVPKEATLLFSYIGYQSQEVKVQETMTIKLKEDNELLEEVVVVGYGTQKKANLTGAVDKISSETMDALQVNTIGEALQGQIPNLNIDIADGKPGRDASFNIRGTTSLNGGSPLIIIDGIPSNETQLNNLSPRDVEDISVLKDAASAAIYGARGTFGVILVQTKRAKQGEFKISYNNRFGWSKATKIVEPYGNASDYLDIIQNEFNNNIGQYGVISQAEIDYAHQAAADPSLPPYKFIQEGGQQKLVAGGHVQDFYHEWFKTYSPKQSHHISISGGGEKLRYFVSGDFNHEEGALKLKPDKINRYTIHSNIVYDINKTISFFNKSSFTIRDEKLPNMYVTGWRSNIWRWMEMFNHALWPTDVEIDGKTVVTESGFLKRFISDYSDYTKKRHEISNTLGLDLSFLKGDLKIHGDFTYQYSNLHTQQWGDVTGVGQVWADNNALLNAYGANSYFRRSMENARNMNVNAYATYDKSVKDHHFTLMAGMNWEDYDFINEYAERKDPLSINEHSLNMGTGEFTASDSDSKYANQSTFFRVNYDYMSRYLLEINGCYNISSRFAAGNRDAFFASVSSGWRVSEEAFFEPLKKTIDNLKLRLSYGSLGNQNIGVWSYLSMLQMTQSNFNLEGSQVSYTNNPSPKSSNFTWETTETIDVGADITLLNRLSATFDWYQRTTKDMLTKYHSLPSVYGATVPQENNATLRNRGWEVSLNWKDQFKLADKNFSYGIRLSLSDYKSIITDYYNPTNYLGDYYEGMELGEIWGLNTLGLFATDEEAKNSPILDTNGYRQYIAAGCLKFEDVDKDGKISRNNWTLDDHGDFKIIGNTTPRYQYGITLNAAWSGFDLNIFFKGVGKRDIYPSGESAAFWGPYSRRYTIMPQHVADDRWTEENPNAYFPRPQGYIAGNGNYDLNVTQTRYLQNAAYLRLKNLVVGYTIPKVLTRKAKIENLRVFLSGQNLFEFTKLHDSLDPEGLALDPDAESASGWVGMGTAYPVQRVFSFGLEVQF